MCMVLSSLGYMYSVSAQGFVGRVINAPYYYYYYYYYYTQRFSGRCALVLLSVQGRGFGPRGAPSIDLGNLGRPQQRRVGHDLQPVATVAQLVKTGGMAREKCQNPFKIMLWAFHVFVCSVKYFQPTYCQCHHKNTKTLYAGNHA